MKRVCSWCGDVSPSVNPQEGSNGDTTHTICDQCSDNISFQAGVPLKEYLEALKVPVLLVDSGGVIQYANHLAVVQIGKRPDEIKGCYGGDVFECTYARLPEGCGKTEHCSGCAIRRTVRDTFESGKSHDGVTALLSTEVEGVMGEKKFEISTFKGEEGVFLRVEEIGI
jgi:PAS domain-containing protein